MSILVIVEYRKDELLDGTKEAFAVAKALASDLQWEFNAVILGRDLENLANTVGQYGPNKVYVVDDPLLGDVNVLSYTTALSTVVNQVNPKLVLSCATLTMSEILPRVAIRTKASILSGCTKFESNNGSFKVLIPTYEDMIFNEIIPTRAVTIATLLRGSIAAAEPDSSHSAAIEKMTVSDMTDDREEFIDETFVEATVDISKAKIIVAGGLGVGTKENYDLIWQLRDKLGGSPIAEVGATRLAIDLEMVPYDHEIGQTGKIVTPDLFISAGISGAIQHVFGMKNSKTIIAINTDEEAPIWKVAHYGIVGDLVEVIPEFLKRL